MSGYLWERFLNLNQTPPLEIGTVIAVYATHCMVSKLNGDEIQVKPSAVSVGSRVFIRNGEITGTAPALRQVEIEI